MTPLALTRIQRWLAVLLVGAGIAGATSGARRGEGAAAQPDGTKAPAARVVVRVQTIAPTAIPEFSEAVGTVRSRTTTVLSSKVMAWVRAVLAAEGERVTAGQPLIRLDDRDLVAQLRRADAALEEAHNALDEAEKAIAAAEAARAAAVANSQFAEATLRRYQLMLEQEAVSRQEFDAVLAKQKAADAELGRAEATIKALQAKKRQVLAKIAQAKAEAANAQLHLEYATIRAPLDGIVLEKRAEVGTLAAPGVPLLVLEDSRAYRLEAAVPEAQLRQITLGLPVTVSLEALGRAELAGAVAEITPAADPASRTVVVKIELPSVAGLRSGLYGKARFPKGERPALLLPRSALIERGQLQSVFVVEEGNVARLRLVTTGKRYGDRVEILSGLKAGDAVVVAGMERLVDGAAVEVAR